MRLTILGGSAAGVGTGQGCSGYLVETDTTRLVMDLGPNTLLELRKHTDFRTLDGIVISHLHMDHLLDVFALRFALKYNPRPANRPTPLFLPPGGLAYMKKAAELFVTDDEDASNYFSAVYDMREYDPDSKLTIGDLTLAFSPTKHVIPCWSIRVHSNDDSGDLFYTGDTGASADLSAISKGVTVVISEAAAKPGTDPGRIKALHLLPEQAASIARDAGATHLVLTHMWEENGPESAVEAARSVYDGRITIATPGLSLSW